MEAVAAVAAIAAVAAAASASASASSSAAVEAGDFVLTHQLSVLLLWHKHTPTTTKYLFYKTFHFRERSSASRFGIMTNSGDTTDGGGGGGGWGLRFVVVLCC